MFKISKKSNISQARLGEYQTLHGRVLTPFFMVVATQGAVKHVSMDEVRGLKAQVLLSNTYHLMLRPGSQAIKKAGGLHSFMNWNGPILTDSGGFQIFSLAETANRSGQSLVKLDSEGVEFRSYIDGSKHYLTPEKALQIQMDLGVDIAVCLDECVALPAEKEYIKRSIELTTHWAKKTLDYAIKNGAPGQPLVHCVVQGGLDKESRLKSLRDLIEIGLFAKGGPAGGWDGYNIGGLSVGEPAQEMYGVLDYLCPEMPEDKPRYLMGVGYPDNIVEAVKRGVDMFDCVIPTREGRHGRLFVWNHKDLNKKDFYHTLNINNQEHCNNFSLINPESKLPELRQYSLAYLNYLFKIKEPLGQRLASLNNIEFYLDLMENLREGISAGDY